MLLSGMRLLIPDKTDPERDAVANVWQLMGGTVVPVGKFWEFPIEFEKKAAVLYGNHIFCLVLAQRLGLNLLSPADDILTTLGQEWLHRAVEKGTIQDAACYQYPCFIKPMAPKLFTAGIFKSHKELLAQCQDLAADTAIIRSDIVTILSEARLFVLHNTVVTSAIYEGNASLTDANEFAKDFLNKHDQCLPHSFVLDVGLLDNNRWAIIEFNASWGAGLNGCDPGAAALCIATATESGIIPD